MNPMTSAELVRDDCLDDFYKIIRADGSHEEISTTGISEDLKNEIENLPSNKNY